jgi:N utilization substance protein B
MGARRKSREMALQFLYLVDAAKMTSEDARKSLFDSWHAPDKVREFAEHLVTGTLAQTGNLDTLITKYAENWEMRRMTAVDRNVMRLAAFELLNELETPISVIIDEAVEIAKTFSTEESGKFVNGILDKIKLERTENIAAPAEGKEHAGEL